MNSVSVFGPSAVEELNGAASLGSIMNTDCQTCLRNFADCSLLQSRLKARAVVIDCQKVRQTRHMSGDVGNYTGPLLSPECTCVHTGGPANTECRLLLAGIKDENKYAQSGLMIS